MISRIIISTFIFCIIGYGLWSQETVNLSIGDKYYDYTIVAPQDIESVIDLNLRDYDIHCVNESEVLESKIPRVDFQLGSKDKKLLIGVADDMVLWKGTDGPDPFLGINKYYQFKEGVPLYNLKEPSDFNRKGQLTIYLEYKVEELPDNVGIWCTLMEYTKFKVKVQVDYKATYVEQHQQAFSEVVTYELKNKVVFKVVDYQAKLADEWVDVVSDAHPSLIEYFASVTMSDTRLCNRQYPLGKVIYTSAPESKVVFRNSTPILDLPVCNESENQIYVYPNPTFGEITIRMEDTGYGPYTLELYNVVGHSLLKETLASAPTIIAKYNLSYLEKGIYLYGIKDRRGVNLQTKRLIVVKR